MKFLHAMVRVKDLDESLKFFTELMGLKLVKRKDYEEGRFTLAYLESEGSDAQIELTHNWDNSEDYSYGNSFGHLAFEVENIYETCEKLMAADVVINRPPRDGYMAFFKTPDGISIELLQKGEPLSPQLPWDTMKNTGSW